MYIDDMDCCQCIIRFCLLNLEIKSLDLRFIYFIVCGRIMFEVQFYYRFWQLYKIRDYLYFNKI